MLKQIHLTTQKRRALRLLIDDCQKNMIKLTTFNTMLTRDHFKKSFGKKI